MFSNLRAAMIAQSATIAGVALWLAACGNTPLVTSAASSTAATAGTASATNAAPATVPGDPVSFGASTYSVSQGAGFVILTVLRSGSSTDSVSVGYATADGTAIGGTDYTAVSGQLLWAQNDTSPKTISIPIAGAVPFNGSKNFSVALNDPSANAAISSPDTATVTISGDAAPAAGNLEFSDQSYSVDQGSGTVTVSVNRIDGSNGAASVSYATANGTALAGTDYTATSGSLHWPDGDATPKTFTVAISGKTPFAGTKSFGVDLSAPSGGAIVSPATATVAISGDATASAGTVALSAAAYSVGQAAGTITVTADRVGGSTGAISVNYATANGTALAGADYTAASGTITWTAGDASVKTFTVAISGSSPYSGSKNFSVSLSAPSAGTAVSSPGTATITIDGDGGASSVADLQFSSATYSVSQSAGSVTVTVDHTGASATAVGVSYSTANGTAVAGTDYTEATGTLQWAAGDTAAKSFTVPVSNTTAFSGTKNFTVALSAPSGGATDAAPSAATVTINGRASSTATSTFWVYYNGVFNWGGDYSSGARPNYVSTAGNPESGPYDIAISLTTKYGLFLPYAGGTVPTWDFDSAPYNYLTVDLKPTIANQVWQLFFVEVGDKDIVDKNGQLILVNLANYGPAPVAGKWATYKIPLVDVLTQWSSGSPVYLQSVYKFGIQDQTGLSSNTWYIDNIGFTVN